MLTMREFHQLNRIVDEIFEQAGDMSFKQLAEKSGLSYGTVRNLNHYVTMYPRTQTVLLLARAVGMDLKLTVAKKPKLKVYA